MLWLRSRSLPFPAAPRPAPSCPSPSVPGPWVECARGLQGVTQALAAVPAWRASGGEVGRAAANGRTLSRRPAIFPAGFPAVLLPLTGDRQDRPPKSLVIKLISLIIFPKTRVALGVGILGTRSGGHPAIGCSWAVMLNTTTCGWSRFRTLTLPWATCGWTPWSRRQAEAPNRGKASILP